MSRKTEFACWLHRYQREISPQQPDEWCFIYWNEISGKVGVLLQKDDCGGRSKDSSGHIKMEIALNCPKWYKEVKLERITWIS